MNVGCGDGAGVLAGRPGPSAASGAKGGKCGHEAATVYQLLNAGNRIRVLSPDSGTPLRHNQRVSAGASQTSLVSFTPARMRMTTD